MQVNLLTDDSAQLYVDNKLVGVGSWGGELPLASKLVLRAVVPDAPTTCRTALRDTVLTQLTAGQRISIELPVRACALVRYKVEPRDARVTFAPIDGGRSYQTRADSLESYSLPTGRYVMRITAPYCIMFSDTVAVTRSSGDVLVPRKLVCN